MVKPILNPDTEQRALMLFAQGMNRKQVTTELINTAPELFDTGMESQELRNYVRNLLRSIDPKSPKFAETKYRQNFEQYRVIVYQELRENVSNIQQKCLNDLSLLFGDIDQIASLVKGDIQNASDTEPTGNSEFLSSINMYLRLQEAKVKTAGALTEIVKQLAPTPGQQQLPIPEVE